MKVTIEYLLSSFILFIMVISGFTLATMGVNVRKSSEGTSLLSSKAQMIASNLVSNPGEPPDWEAYGNFTHLGLASRGVPGELSPAKVKALLEIDPHTVWEYMKKTYDIDGFMIRFIPAIEVTVNYLENPDRFEVYVYSNEHKVMLSNAEVHYLLVYTEVNVRGSRVEFTVTNVETGTVVTDEEGRAVVYVSFPSQNVEYIFLGKANYYGYAGVGYNSSGGVELAELYINYQFLISEYVGSEVINNTLVLTYSTAGPTNASVHVSEVVYIFNGTGWEEWYWDTTPGQSDNILTKGQGKNTLVIPLPDYTVPSAPLIVIIPVGFSAGPVSGGFIFTLLPAYYYGYNLGLEAHPIPEVEYGYGMGEANRNVAVARRVVDVAGITYIMEVLVSG